MPIHSFLGFQVSVVGIATRYGLYGPGVESVGATFSPPVLTGFEAHTASCATGTVSRSGG